MSDIIDRQTFVISVNLSTFVPAPTEVPSIVNLPMNLRFAADELVLKSIVYHPPQAGADVRDTIQIWCNVTNDNLIGFFTNTAAFGVQHDEHFRISNTFQTGNFQLQFQGTDGSLDNAAPNPHYGPPGSYNSQRLISNQNPQRTFGVVVMTIEFLKLKK